MSASTGRIKRAEAIRDIRDQSNTGLFHSFVDLLESEIADALTELELADTTTGIWRAQGRAAGVRTLLAAITPQNGE